MSPRNNTFDEACHIGGIIAKAVGKKLSEQLDYFSEMKVSCLQKFVDLPKRQVPPVEWADQHQKKALEHFEILKKTSKNPQEIRTAEVDWFGAKELFHLSTLAASNALEETYKKMSSGRNTDHKNRERGVLYHGPVKYLLNTPLN